MRHEPRSSGAHATDVARPASPPDTSVSRHAAMLTSIAAVTALGGAAQLLVFRNGNRFLPLDLLEHTPFSSFLVPGLILGLVVAGLNAMATALILKRARLAIDATLLAGSVLLGWIVVEIALFRQAHIILHGFYGALAVSICAFGLVPAARSRRARYKWILAVTLAEAIGFMAPTWVGLLSATSDLARESAALLLVCAGLVEGAALGLGQSLALPLQVRRLPYVALTALGAGVAWASVMALMMLFQNTTIPTPLLAGLVVVVALIAMMSIGVAQWVELRRHSVRAGRWITWTAFAWSLSLPLSFAPAPFVDTSTPLYAHAILWGCGGLLMAFIFASVTWLGVKDILRPHLSSFGRRRDSRPHVFSRLRALLAPA